MMLIGENSRTVTQAVKPARRAASVATSRRPHRAVLRSPAALVDRTISTGLRNLAEGAALVILAAVSLLRDARWPDRRKYDSARQRWAPMLVSGCARCIGNLMSLGAIDSGLIVDGAKSSSVESMRCAVWRSLLCLRCGHCRRRRRQVVSDATMEVRGATVFGEAIIAIVYLPILALQGIEGKLFQPMAPTVLARPGDCVCAVADIGSGPVQRPASTFPQPEHEGALFSRLQRGVRAPARSK